MTGADVLVGALGVTETAAKRLERVIADSIVRETRCGRTVRWACLGSFLPRRRKARRIRNPATKRLMRLPAIESVGLRAFAAAKRRAP